MKSHGEAAHQRAEDYDDNLRDQQDPLAVGLRVDVGPVDVVGAERGHRDALRGACRDDGHEQHHRHHDRAAGAEEVRRDRRRHEAGARLRGRNGQLQRHAREAQGGRQSEGDGKPHEAAEEVALVGARGLRGDGGLPIGLVHEDRPEVAHDVDDAELEAAAREHRQVGALPVVRHRAARVLPRLVEAGLQEAVPLLREDPPALALGVAPHGLQAHVDSVR
mmetsp:Transcript_49679/g.137979  ORF Transcript_49679/g.137979 Transcript_49679/m.137979 type:complete len:220 (-) Transcript_49679:676-1335(-)